MNLLVSLVLSILVLMAVAGYWRYRWRSMLLASALLFLTLLGYNSVRAFAYLAVDEHYLAELASTHPELRGYSFDPKNMTAVRRPPIEFNTSNGYYDHITEVRADHPWHGFTQFTVKTQWLTKENRIVAVLALLRGNDSRYFSGLTWGPDTLPGSGWLISESSLKEFKNAQQ
jgi:ABC-type transport system involved in multi-copper enzyme maturation permease subunit